MHCDNADAFAGSSEALVVLMNGVLSYLSVDEVHVHDARQSATRDYGVHELTAERRVFTCDVLNDLLFVGFALALSWRQCDVITFCVQFLQLPCRAQT